MSTVKGPVVQQVQYFAGDVQQRISLINVKGELGMAVQISPSVKAKTNHEVVTRFKTSIDGDVNFYSDDGSDMHPREGGVPQSGISKSYNLYIILMWEVGLVGRSPAQTCRRPLLSSASAAFSLMSSTH